MPAVRSSLLTIVTTALLIGCDDSRESLALRPSDSPTSSANAEQIGEVNASTRWNRRAAALLTQRPPANPQAAASRMLTYLSLAQYRAAITAKAFERSLAKVRVAE